MKPAEKRRVGLPRGVSRTLLSLATAAPLFAGTVSLASAQETTQPDAQPVPIISGQSGGAGASGGTTSGGASVEAPTPPPEARAEPLQPGPPAGEARAAFYANPAVIGGAAAATAIVVCAIICFSHSSNTTTSTTVIHQ